MLNTQVRDRMAVVGKRFTSYMRWVMLAVCIFYFSYLFWASWGLKVCNAAEIAIGCIDGDGLSVTVLTVSFYVRMKILQ